MACSKGHPPEDWQLRPNGSYHLCKRCRAIAKPWLTPEWKGRKAARRRRLRDEAIRQYGGKCVCCGETRRAFLCIDHIDGGGYAHRAELSGREIYPWLARNGYPKDGYQLLCWNCNSAKHFEGECPHETERRALLT